MTEDATMSNTQSYCPHTRQALVTLDSAEGSCPGESPCEVLNPATLLPTPKGSLPFHSCLETLDCWAEEKAFGRENRGMEARRWEARGPLYLEQRVTGRK